MSERPTNSIEIDATLVYCGDSSVKLAIPVSEAVEELGIKYGDVKLSDPVRVTGELTVEVADGG